MGMRHIRGPVEHREFGIGSAYTQGDVLTLDGTRRLSRHSGGEQDVVGVALSDSADSIRNVGLVIVPLAGSYFRADVPTGIAASAVSVGQTLGLYSVSGSLSYITTSYTSEAGRPLIVAGAIDSETSTIEVSFKVANIVLGSSASQALA